MPALSGAAPERGDWPAKVADSVEGLVATVRSRSVQPLALVARVLAFSLVALAMGLLLVAGLAIAVVRILDVYAFTHRVYLSYVITGGIFTLAGMFFFVLRTSRR
jgi:hypothetical protein